MHNNQLWIECNYFFFKKHKDALNYYKKLCSGEIVDLKEKPEGAVQHYKVMSHKNLYRIAQYSYPEILRLNPFSETVWTRVWYGCNYNFLAKNDFRILKEGYLTEINEYRKMHGVPPLVKNSYLEKLADSRAKKLASPKNFTIKNYEFLGNLDAIEPLHSANFAIRNFYDKFMSRYNWGGKNRISNYIRYSQIVWKSTKEVGIGTRVSDKIIYICFIFSPKGGFRKFKRNVFPVQEKHLYIHNFYRRCRSL
uniref:SCP domain-containing protein n=1 Tax=Strongyloides venezuelensis TaxID=75913 RepID=A0A0K0FJB5_STRVS